MLLLGLLLEGSMLLLVGSMLLLDGLMLLSLLEVLVYH